MTDISRRDAPKQMNVLSLRKAIDGIEDHNEKVYAAAVWYSTSGFHIVPFINRSGEQKGGTYPKGLSQHHATTSGKIIDSWWHPEEGKFKGAAIAMAHGGSAGYVAIDLDRKEDVDGIKTFTDLVQAYGDYNDGTADSVNTLMASTPSGGRHLVFRYHPEIVSNSEVSYSGVDTRGGLKRNPLSNGGITFVEPSVKPGSDPLTAPRYRWDDSVTQIIDMPQWLVDVLNGRPPNRGGMTLQESYVESAMGLHGHGRDTNIYGDLLRYVGIGYQEDQLWELMPQILARMSPPDEDMVRRKIASALESEAYRAAQKETESRNKVSSMKLDHNEKGHVRNTAKNMKEILNSALFAHEYGDIRYDEFYHGYTRNGDTIASHADYTVGIQIWISTVVGLEVGTDSLRKSIEYMAYKRPHTNAARDYMLACPFPAPSDERDDNYWGSGRKGPGPAFRRLIYEVMDLGNRNLHQGYTEEKEKAYESFLWFWMQGVCARACVPGCKMEIVLNLFGGQGIAKSTFFRDLCPDPAWFTDSVGDVISSAGKDIKDEIQKMHAKLIVELAELTPIKKGGQSADEKMKTFISTQCDSFRRSYGTDTVDYPRTSALCGTSNNNDMYRDVTGNRRYLSIDHGNIPFNLGDRDNGVMAKIRDFVWGELVSSFDTGELGQPRNALLVCVPPNLRRFQAIINSDHRYEEIGLPDVLEWMSDKTRLTWSEIVGQAKETPGMRDSKESSIMTVVRNALKHDDAWQWRKRSSRRGRSGKVERGNFWINMEHEQEKDAKPGQASPKHWADTAGNTEHEGEY